MDFLSIDFETADSLHTSPCALGLSLVNDNAIVFRTSYLIDPEVPFSLINTKIHGISESDIFGCPTFKDVWDEIACLVSSYPVVAHNASFDISVLTKAAKRYGIKIPDFEYYCTYRLYRYNHPNLGSYSLVSLCDTFGIELIHHHDCLCDCDAAAKLMLALQDTKEAIIFQESNIPQDFNIRSRYTKINGHRVLADCYIEADIEYDIVDSIDFIDKRFVITGEFSKYSRSEISSLIQENGGIVGSSISKKTDYLIVAYENINLVIDKSRARSHKLIEAEKLRSVGNEIKIISDENFLEIMNLN